jgi:predicted hydrocarbon binding protein
MHGLIFEEIKNYAENRLGSGGWEKLLKQAGLSGRVYNQVQAYPDTDALQLVGAASQMSGQPLAAVIEDFGEFVAPDLLRMSQPLIKSEWKTLDLLEHTEATIHRVVRLDNPGAEPPALHVERKGSDRVLIVYSSPRKMCSLAKGICKGIAKHYGETVTIAESRCMLNGDTACHITVDLES